MNIYFDKHKRTIIPKARFGNLNPGLRNSALLSGVGTTLSSLAINNTANKFLYLDHLSKLKESFTNRALKVAVDIEKLRKLGIEYHWKQERLLVKLGGKTRSWTPEEASELISKSKVRGYEGHHINSVAKNPNQAVDPNNVEPLTHSEHFAKHGGNWKNPTEGELLDRTRMIKNRVWFQSVAGEIGVTAIVFGVAFLAGTAISIAINRNRSFSYHKKVGLSTGGVSVVTYLSGRVCTIFATPITKYIAEQLTHKFGEEVAKQFAGRLVFGIGASIALSIITLIKLSRMGHSWSYSLKQARNVFIVSIASIIIASFICALVKSALSGGMYGSMAGPAGVAAGIVASLIFTGIVLLFTANRRNKIAINLIKCENEGFYLLASKTVA